MLNPTSRTSRVPGVGCRVLLWCVLFSPVVVAGPPFFMHDGYGFSGPQHEPADLIHPTVRNEFDAEPPGWSMSGDIRFHGGIADGNKNIWLAPAQGNMVVRINTTTGAIEGFEPPAVARGDARPLYFGGAYDGRYAWFVPENAQAILRVDTHDGSMAEFDSFPSGLGPGTIRGAVYDGVSHVWAASYANNGLLKLDVADGSMQGIDLGYGLWNDGDWGGVVCDGEAVWVMPSWSPDIPIARVDMVTNAVTLFDFPSGTPTSPFRGGLFDGKQIVILPRESGLVALVNRTTGSVSYFGGFPSTIVADAFFGGVFDGYRVWMIPYQTEYLVSIDLESRVISAAYTTGVPGNSYGFLGGMLLDRRLYLLPRSNPQMLSFAPPTATVSGTASLSETTSVSRSESSSGTASVSPTRTISLSATPSVTATPTKSMTPTKSATRSETTTLTETDTLSETAPPTETITPSKTALPTKTITPPVTATLTGSTTGSASGTDSATSSVNRPPTPTHTWPRTASGSSSQSSTESSSRPGTPSQSATGGTGSPTASRSPAAARTVSVSHSSAAVRSFSPPSLTQSVSLPGGATRTRTMVDAPTDAATSTVAPPGTPGPAVIVPNTTSAAPNTTEPPPAPTPSPASPAESDAQFAGHVSAGLTGAAGAISGAAAAAQVARGLGVLGVLDACRMNGDLMPTGSLGFPRSVLPFVKFGAEPGQYYRGAVVAGLLVWVLVSGVYVAVIAALVGNGTLGKEREDLSTMERVLTYSRMPGRLMSWGVALMYGVSVGSTTLLVGAASDGGGDTWLDVCLAVVGLGWCVGLVVAMGVAVARALRPLGFLKSCVDCRNASKPLSVKVARKLNGRVLRFLLFGYDAWLPPIDTEGVGKKAAREQKSRIGVLFEEYRTDLQRPAAGTLCTRFLLVEAALAGVMGGLQGIAWKWCELASVLTLLVSALAFALVIALRPYRVGLSNVLVVCVSALLTAAAALVVVASVGSNPDVRSTAASLAVGAVALPIVDVVLPLVRRITLSCTGGMMTYYEEDMCTTGMMFNAGALGADAEMRVVASQPAAADDAGLGPMCGPLLVPPSNSSVSRSGADPYSHAPSTDGVQSSLLVGVPAPPRSSADTFAATPGGPSAATGVDDFLREMEASAPKGPAAAGAPGPVASPLNAAKVPPPTPRQERHVSSKSAANDENDAWGDML